MQSQVDIVEMTADIVSAYVSANLLNSDELPKLITTVHSALRGVAVDGEAGPAEELTPAVPIKKSITNEYLICLEDGKKFKSLKRHLRTRYNLTPDEYRQKWGLARDYPMVAPSYAKARSELAKRMGLGKPRNED